MKVRYNLSKKQKAAMDSGEPLRLAIPTPFGENGRHDYKEIAKDGLGVELPKGSVGIATVFCSLLNRGGGGPDSLQSYMGEIVDAQNTHLMPCYELPVIIVSINGGKAPTRWPAGPVVLEDDE